MAWVGPPALRLGGHRAVSRINHFFGGALVMIHRRSIVAMTSATLAVALGLTVTGFAGAGLIPGGGPSKSDCYVELSVDGIDNPSDRVQKNKTVLVTDGEAGDTGPCGDFKCNVSLGACINQTDPNLADCTPPASLDQLKVRGAFSVSVPELLTGSACGAFVTAEVSAKVKRDGAGNVKKAKPGKARIKLTAKAPKGTKPRTDVDNVTVQCLPRTVECPASSSGAFLD
jgi:hypothetical protein